MTTVTRTGSKQPIDTKAYWGKDTDGNTKAVEEAQRALKNCETQLNAALQDNDSKNREICVLSGKLESAEKEQQELKSKNSVLEQELAKTKAQFNKINASNAKMITDIATLNKAKDTLSAEVSKLNEMLSRVQDQNIVAKKIVSAVDSKNEDHEEEIKSKPEGVCEPTATTMQNMITDVKPLCGKIDALLNDINTFRNRVQTTYEHLASPDTEIKDLEEKMNGNSGYIKSFNDYTTRYMELAPEVNDFDNRMQKLIKEATRITVPHEHLITVSSRNDIPLPLLIQNDSKYEDLLKQLRKARSKEMMEIWSKVERRFGDACGHINKIYAKIQPSGWLTGLMGSSTIVSWPPVFPKKEVTKVENSAVSADNAPSNHVSTN